jgi:hemoglobin/transferrin/lactoferrin receptor protein
MTSLVRWSGRLLSTLSLSWQRGDQKSDQEGAGIGIYDPAEPLGAVATLRWVDDPRRFDAELNGTFQSGVDRVSSPTLFRPEGYHVYGAVLGWSPLRHVTLRGSLDNIFDTRYFLPSAVLYAAAPSSDAVARTNPLELQVQPGRNFRLGVTVAF